MGAAMAEWSKGLQKLQICNLQQGLEFETALPRFYYTFFFYKQLHFPSEPGVANEIWENEAESCLTVAISKIPYILIILTKIWYKCHL